MIEFSRPRLTVATLVEREGRFLFVREQIRERILLNQPAGHVEGGETLVEAAKRETLEETGWEVEPQAVLGMYHHRTPEGTTYFRVALIARLLRHHPDHPLDRGILEAIWLTRDQLIQSPTRGPMVLRCVEDYLAGTRYPLTVIHSL